MGETEKIKSLLTSERVARDFGLNKSQPKPKINLEPQTDNFVEEEVVEEPESTAMDKFLAVERVETMKHVRDLIQKEVDARMQETENEQFDIEWDKSDPTTDVRKWTKTLSRFGRNTKSINDALKRIEEIDSGEA